MAKIIYKKGHSVILQGVIDGYELYISDTPLKPTRYILVKDGVEYLLYNKLFVLENNKTACLLQSEIDKEENYTFVIYNGKIFKYENLLKEHTHLYIDGMKNFSYDLKLSNPLLEKPIIVTEA